ncbi:Ig domain-containing protein [Tahibacter soli]|uniref:Ig domain-containing protein n=1 Tax=Tahibacter soli TaxID=2983605 RepID=A0A9X4BI27_9GAMM|nr:Ig domain-containing protein [Tahibacter soli]MDC8014835.1 Ig domain-containing protein [Tahibacter soli]
MKKSAAILGLAAALFGCVQAQAAINTIDNVPAATLLLPNFEIGTDPASHTVITVGNRAATETLAHVVLWTDRGVPSASFDVRLPARGVSEIDLSAIFTTGALPQSTAGGFGTCAGTLPPAPLDPVALRNAHTGAASALLAGQCGSTTHGDTVARGYVTIDATSACTALVPGSAGYFVNGGTGIATNANVLWGEVSTTHSGFNTSTGDALVAIEADGANAATTGASYTFYGRRIGSSADNRERLPAVHIGRYTMQDVLFRTSAQVWRDPGNVAPFVCGNPPAGLDTQQVIAFDNREEPSVSQSAAMLPLATQSVRLDDPAQAAVPFTLGFIYYHLDLATAAPPFGNANQGYVTLTYRALSGEESKASGWTGLGLSGGILPITIEQCSDGIDNDGDGLIDFPNDPGCVDSHGVEAAPCSDGIDNDGDLLIDYPNDPECGSAHDITENAIVACDDGIDNDGDGLIDYPNDPQCNFQNDNTENFGQCDDGIDNDGDGLIDFPADPGCTSPSDSSETAPACSDGVDNDGDGLVDFPNDPGCANANSNNEAPACNDGTDNDGDGFTDFPADVGCASASSTNESPACNDGVDNDGDGLTDFPADPVCASPSDTAEQTQCSDGFDNDGDGLIDFPADPGCTALNDTSEQNAPQCGDGIDNDGNGTIDFPQDPGCTTATDAFEGPDCSDGVDNDQDGLIDALDPGCTSPTDVNELSDAVTRACNDGIDNDGDGFTDFPADTGCQGAWDDVEFSPTGGGTLITINPATLPNGTVNFAYPAQALVASGGLAPYTFAVTAGALPPGLTLSPAGAITGIGTAVGTFGFTVTATDANGFSGTRSYTINIVLGAAAVPVPALSTLMLALLTLLVAGAAWFFGNRRIA